MKHPTMSGLINSAQTRKTLWLVVSCIVPVLLLSIESIAILDRCNLFHTKSKLNDKNCKPSDFVPGNYYHNIPILTSVYCFNNGTGICKVLAGRFEFYMNSWTQEYLGPVKRDDYHGIDQHGYHRRVPVTYTINGTVLYHDRAINWSRWFTKGKTQRLKLLSSKSFNWCKYAPTNNWPYKSAILDRDGSTQIYFFNRQACIYDPKTNETTQHNTRSFQKSWSKIDLDYNPTIWAMEVQRGNVRLIKHKRELLTESTWELRKTNGLKSFIEIESVQKNSAIIAGKGPFIRREFYNRSSNICISDFYLRKTNDYSVDDFQLDQCGIDSKEIAVHGTYDSLSSRPDIFTIEVGLHNVPFSYPAIRMFFAREFGYPLVPLFDELVKNGYAFSATTVIKVENLKYFWDVIRLSYDYQGSPSGNFDEQYPKTYIEGFRARVQTNPSNQIKYWVHNVTAGTKGPPYRKEFHKDLNYVDDIEYLPRCKTILVIFGPLYTEYPVDKFDVDTETLIGSIYALGANELINAFFANDDKLYFYHRLNFVAEHKYTCGKSADELVTADPGVRYYYRYGTDALDVFPKQRPGVTNHQEEKLFQDLGIFQGTLGPPEAPDAAQFDFDPTRFTPESNSINWWLWVLILLGVLLLIGMVLLGVNAYQRRIRRRRYLAPTQRSSLPSAASGMSRVTARSGGLTSNRVSPFMTQRTRVSSIAPRSSSLSRRRTSSPGGRSQSSRRSSSKPSGMSSRSPAKSSMHSSHHSPSRSSSASSEPSSSHHSSTASHGKHSGK